MGTVKVMFSRKRLPVSLLIRLVTWSSFSHCEILDGNELIGADMIHGVMVTPLDQRLRASSYVSVVDFPCEDPDAVIKAARSQLGKGYDFLGLLGLITHQRRWQSTENWFCSELVAWSFSAAGQPVFRDDMVARITPQNLWILAHPEVSSDNPITLLEPLTERPGEQS